MTAIAPGSGSVRFVAFGDSGTLFPQQFQNANLIAGETFDLALHAGDTLVLAKMFQCPVVARVELGYYIYLLGCVAVGAQSPNMGGSVDV